LYIAVLAVVGRAALQGDLDGLETWANSSFGKFNKGKCNILPWGSDKSMQQYGLGINQLKSNFTKKNLQTSWTRS